MRNIEGLNRIFGAAIIGSSLKFFSFHLLRQIFDLSAYYVEATTTDL
ncbi:protein of unassigned function [Methylobacterium oryzae CBMB20]|uniref:Protein of unassigned function n=1 Tax=Methylobacterium oryzae CBMB20 TaxID=693986 RepID=A0A089NWX9_9HYPH|nr:protein of unassigned function [Methylobacterium oryzae CBMB20]